MPETISAALVGEKRKLSNTAPWIWLFEIDIDSTTTFRVAAYDQSVSYGGYTYQPFPVTIGYVGREGSGVLTDVELTISNAGGEIAVLVEQGKIIDQNVTIRVVHSGNLVSGGAQVEDTFTAREVTMSMIDAVILLGHHNLMSAQFPAQLFSRSRCRWLPTYGGVGCLYDKSLPNLVGGTYPNFDPTKCDGTLDGGNGCRPHGKNEAANGRIELHPLQWGGFRGIPKGPARA